MSSHPLTVVGLDLSLTSTGMAVGEEIHLIQSKAKGMERLDEILGEISFNLPANPLVMIEGYAFAKRTSHAAALGELGGVVRYDLWLKQVPYVEVPPTVRAKFATGRGNAGKSEVISSVSVRTGRVFEGKGADDLCDAFVLQEMGLARLGQARYSWPKAQLAVLDNLSWPDTIPPISTN